MSVVAFIDQSPRVGATVEYAVWAAKALDQPLVLVTVDERDMAGPPLEFDTYQHMDMQEDMLREMSFARERQDEEKDLTALTQHLQQIARKAKDLGVERIKTCCVSDTFEQAIHATSSSDDLLVFGKRGDSNAKIGDWIEPVLRVNNRVFLLVPDHFAPINSWMLAYDGRPASGNCVRFLTRTGLLRETPGRAVTVGGDSATRLHFRDTIRHLTDAGHTVTPFELSGAADDVLAATLQVAPVDLLVMGAFGQGRVRSMMDRSTTSRLLRSFPGPVIVARA